jgi:hypothetical protein
MIRLSSQALFTYYSFHQYLAWIFKVHMIVILCLVDNNPAQNIFHNLFFQCVINKIQTREKLEFQRTNHFHDPLPELVNAKICWRVDPNSGLPGKWAIIFADATANATFLDNIRSLESDRLSIRSDCLHDLELNGFLRHRTHFLAGDTASSTCPWQAAIAVNIGMPNHFLALFFKRQVGDGTRGARLAAGVTRIITIPKTRHKDWRKDTNPTSLRQAWL